MAHASAVPEDVPLQMDSKLIRIIVIVAVVLGAMAYWGFERSYQKNLSYKGEIEKKYFKKKWGKRYDMSGRHRKHYIVVKTDDGKTKNVRIPRFKAGQFKEGQRVVKVKGERYPEVEGAKTIALSVGELIDTLSP